MNENYEAMSNRQLTERLAEALGLKISSVTPMSGDGLIVYPHSNEINFDPCNNWNDIMPIAVEYKVSIHPLSHYGRDNGESYFTGDWVATVVDGDYGLFLPHSHYFECKSESPQRALAICFLRLKDAQNEPR